MGWDGTVWDGKARHSTVWHGMAQREPRFWLACTAFEGAAVEHRSERQGREGCAQPRIAHKIRAPMCLRSGSHYQP
jgi:hypothetical protein